MTYIRIRIDRDTIIPVPTRTGGTGEGTLYLYFSQLFDPNEQGLPVGGEMADALRAWISGAKVYPVTENGILNVYGAHVEGIEAQRALGTVNFPLVDVPVMGLYDNASQTPLVDAYAKQAIPKPTTPSAVPQIDVGKIAKAIKERQS